MATPASDGVFVMTQSHLDAYVKRLETELKASMAASMQSLTRDLAAVRCDQAKVQEALIVKDQDIVRLTAAIAHKEDQIQALSGELEKQRRLITDRTDLVANLRREVDDLRMQLTMERKRRFDAEKNPASETVLALRQELKAQTDATALVMKESRELRAVGTVGGGCVMLAAFCISEPLVGTIVFIVGGVMFIWFSSRWISMAYPQQSIKAFFAPALTCLSKCKLRHPLATVGLSN